MMFVFIRCLLDGFCSFPIKTKRLVMSTVQVGFRVSTGKTPGVLTATMDWGAVALNAEQPGEICECKSFRVQWRTSFRSVNAFDAKLEL